MIPGKGYSGKISFLIRITIFAFLTTNLSGQIVPDPVLEDDLERLSERATSESSIAEAMEDMVQLAEHPIDLNNAPYEDLARIPFLTENQVRRLSEFRSNYGELLTLFELVSVKGFDSVLIRKIEPYVVLLPLSTVPRFSPKTFLNYGHQDFLVRLEQMLPLAKGFEKPDSLGGENIGKAYYGNPQRYYFRYTYNWFDRVRIGLSGEKDPGEQFFRGAQKWGMDYYAGFICLSNLGFLKNLTIGNFRASFGQGLTFGAGLSTGSMPGFSVSTYQSSSFTRNGGGIRPSLSVSEGDYLRGIAGTIKTGPVEISCFLSYHGRDANVIMRDTILERTVEISSLGSIGYHRTASELADMNSISEFIAGGNICASFIKGINFGIKIGATGLLSRWSARLNPEVKTYNINSFRGSENHVIGVDWVLRYKSLFFAGEISRSANGGVAFVSAATLTPDPRANFTLVYRNYQPEYQNFSGNAFGQNSSNSNECGIYAAINLSVHRIIMLAFFGDFYTFPWLKYRIDRPVQGYETGIMAGLQPSRNLTINLRYHQKKGEINSSAENSNLHLISGSRQRSYRLSLLWNTDLGITLNTRLEVRETKTADNPVSYGYLICQDLQLKSSGKTVSATLRYALFDLPGYDQRIYIYEPEVLYGYSMPAYSGNGIRGCLVVKYRATRWCSIWARCGVTYYSDRTEVGNGLDLRESNTVTELTGQIVFKF